MQLTDLYGRYCHAVDADDPELIVSMFLPEGAFHRTNTSVAFPSSRASSARRSCWSSSAPGRPTSSRTSTG